MAKESTDKNNGESPPVQESNDNMVTNDNTPDAEMETGTCFTCERGGRIVNTLELQIPKYLKDKQRIIIYRGIPYSTIEDYQLTPKGIIITTDRNITITIEGNKLRRIFDALLDHKLRMIRPANEGETIGDGEPEPKKITIKENE